MPTQICIFDHYCISAAILKSHSFFVPLGDDHLILRGGGWQFLEINILTLKMLEINNLPSSGKNINNLT